VELVLIGTPYLLFLGDAPDPLAAKVAQGIKDWRPDLAIGHLRLPECNADMHLPDLSVEEAVARGAKTLVIGVANRGGFISDTWLSVLTSALSAGMDLASGLHTLLRDEPTLVALAEAHSRSLHDVRVPGEAYPIATGRKRSGKRCLLVGSDCSCGKMYTALCLEREMRDRGLKATFRATGQTGILITGGGVPLDAVVADFMAGAVEHLIPDNDSDHWDLIEGQGSLFHPSYSGVSLALIHGGQPDAMILCDEPNRPHMRGLPEYRVPSLERVRDLALEMGRIVNPSCAVTGVALNTSAMDEREALDHARRVEDRLGLPTVDPFRHGAGRLVDALG